MDRIGPAERSFVPGLLLSEPLVSVCRHTNLTRRRVLWLDVTLSPDKNVAIDNHTTPERYGIKYYV